MRKKLLSIFTLLCLAVTSAWADNSCGDGVTWSYDAGTKNSPLVILVLARAR